AGVFAFQRRVASGPARSEAVDPASAQSRSDPRSDVWDNVRRLHSERKTAEVALDTVLASDSSCARAPAALKRARETTPRAFEAEKSAYSQIEQDRGTLLGALRRDRAG